jgi:hypothetical protein
MDPERVMFDMDEFKDVKQTCLDVVARYIVENELVVVGGMAIDFALKAKGDRLYSDDSVPDYDVISTENIKHANNVGLILCNLGIKDVAVVPAVHKTTMRVQTLGYTVFDVTYVHKVLHDKIPTMEWEGMRFIHPIYQKIDQFTSLSFLWDITGPTFNILHRLKKDINRKEMLNTFYNLPKSDTPLGDSAHKVTVEFAFPEVTPENTYRCKVLPHGKLAYAIYKKLFDIEVNKAKTRLKSLEDKLGQLGAVPCDVKVLPKQATPNGATLEFSIPDQPIYDSSAIDNTGKMHVELLINRSHSHASEPSDMEFAGACKAVLGGKTMIKATLFNELARVSPRKLVVNSNDIKVDFSVFNLYGHNLTVTVVSLADLTQGDAHSNQYPQADTHACVVLPSCNFLLAYFLFMYFFSGGDSGSPENDNQESKLYRKYYTTLLEMRDIVRDTAQNDTGLFPKSRDAFAISMDVLENDGGYWMDENYEFFIKNFDNIQQYRKNLSSVPPKNYIKHPNCEISKTFDIDSSEYYESYRSKEVFTAEL